MIKPTQTLTTRHKQQTWYQETIASKSQNIVTQQSEFNHIEPKILTNRVNHQKKKKKKTKTKKKTKKKKKTKQNKYHITLRPINMGMRFANQHRSVYKL